MWKLALNKSFAEFHQTDKSRNSVNLWKGRMFDCLLYFIAGYRKKNENKYTEYLQQTITNEV